MFEKDPFTERIKSKSKLDAQWRRNVAESQRRLEGVSKEERETALAEQMQQRRERLRAFHQLPRTATDPEKVLSHDESLLCREFLSHMNQKLFSKTVKLSEQLPAITGLGSTVVWTMRAYQIGRIEYAQRTRFSELYLCQDGLLRKRTVSNQDVLPAAPYLARVVKYQGLPESNTDISFGSYMRRTKEVVNVIPPRYQNNMGPEGASCGSGYQETREIHKVQEVVWNPKDTLEARLIEIATSRRQPLVEQP